MASGCQCHNLPAGWDQTSANRLAKLRQVQANISGLSDSSGREAGGNRISALKLASRFAMTGNPTSCNESRKTQLSTSPPPPPPPPFPWPPHSPPLVHQGTFRPRPVENPPKSACRPPGAEDGSGWSARPRGPWAHLDPAGIKTVHEPLVRYFLVRLIAVSVSTSKVPLLGDPFQNRKHCM